MVLKVRPGGKRLRAAVAAAGLGVAVLGLGLLLVPMLAGRGPEAPGEGAGRAAGAAPGAAPPLPVDLGGPFALRDQDGARRTEADPRGRYQLLFFGYAACKQICSAALPLMGETVRILEGSGRTVVPVMITIDPGQDVRGVLGPALAAHHPDFVGLTGRRRALARAYDAFDFEFEPLFTDPAGQVVYAHGSFIYLLNPEGRFLTLIPPILTPERAAAIVAGHVPAGAEG